MAGPGKDDQAPRQWSDSLAAAWERHRERLFAIQGQTSEWLIERVDPQPGQTILELAAGPGETGFLAAERVQPGGRVISTDAGQGMVDAARRGATHRGLDNVECRVLDAESIDLPDASVDGVLCRHGLMLMAEPEAALAGARRVLLPGGRLAYAVWGPPERNPWLSLIAMALLENGHPLPGDPTATGGPFSLADPDHNRHILSGAGFAGVDVTEIADVMAFDDAEDYWRFQTRVTGPIAMLVASLPDDRVRAVRATLEPMLAPFAAGDGYEIPTLAVVAAASAP